jgi:hypothetical protein
MGKVKNKWQDRDYVLNWFGHKEGDSQRSYREYVRGGILEGKRPELVGGGLIRSLGGWSEVQSMRRMGVRKLTDERILGSGDFVKRILDEADHRVRKCFGSEEKAKEIKQIIDCICKKEGVDVRELQKGGKRKAVSMARFQIACKLVEEHGIPFSEVARNVGVTTPAIFNILKRNGVKLM